MQVVFFFEKTGEKFILVMHKGHGIDDQENPLSLKDNLEPQTTIYKWLFQLDDSKSLHRKWLFHQTSTLNWLFGVPGTI